MRASLFPYLFLILIAFLTPINTQCQSGHAGITGVVRDPASHGIPAAAIHVRQAQTGFTRSATTNADGAFMIDGLPIGTYSIEVSHAGFSAARSGEIELMIGQTRNLNVKLQLSGVRPAAGRAGNSKRNRRGLGGPGVVRSPGPVKQPADEWQKLDYPASAHAGRYRSGFIGSAYSSVCGARSRRQQHYL